MSLDCAIITTPTNNRDLKAVLLSFGCGVAVKESSFFVVNLKDRPDFFEIIKKYCQDFVLLPKGSKEILDFAKNPVPLEIYENLSRLERMAVMAIANEYIKQHATV